MFHVKHGFDPHLATDPETITTPALPLWGSAYVEISEALEATEARDSIALWAGLKLSGTRSASP